MTAIVADTHAIAWYILDQTDCLSQCSTNLTKPQQAEI
jgi:PIN domain nuclease of toxin-antitoxin system